MSYELIYKVFTIRKGDTLLPMVVMGSNNCYETNMYGRCGRRERNLYQANTFFADKDGKYPNEFKSIEKMNAYYRHNVIKEEIKQGSLQGRYKTPQAILNGFKKYIFDSKDLQIKPYFVDLHYMEETDENKQKIRAVFNKNLETVTEILTDKERDKLVDKCLKDLPEILREKLLKHRGKNSLLIYSYSDEEHEIEHAFRMFKEQSLHEKLSKKEETRYLIAEPEAEETATNGQATLLQFI